jgi:hypothetical protein
MAQRHLVELSSLFVALIGPPRFPRRRAIDDVD